MLLLTVSGIETFPIHFSTLVPSPETLAVIIPGQTLYQMKIKILDTGIFIKENFFHGKKINSLLSLSIKGIIEIYITEITYNELKNKFSSFLDKAISNHKKFTKEQENWILRNNKNSDKLFEKIDKTTIETEFENKLDDFIKEGVIKVIPYKSINIKSVFDNYFQGLPPFGNGDKKSEFPDAFSLGLIKDYLSTKGFDAVVFSTDKDFIKCSSSSLEITNEYDKYLDEKFKHLDKIKSDITNILFLQNKEFLKQSFVDWYKSNLDDFSLYYEAVNYKEIYDLTIDEDDIEIGDLEYNIVNIEDDVVIIEVTGDVNVKVSVLTDDEEFMYYDSDDKSYHYLETNFETFEKKFNSKMIVTTEIISEEDYFEDFEIESINDGVKVSFNIENKYYD